MSAARQIDLPPPLFKGPAGALMPALTHAEALVPARNTIPILACVLLETSPEGLFVTTNDLTLGYREQVDNVAREPWAGCADAARLKAFVDGAESDREITISAADADWLAVRAGRASCRLPLLPGNEFPRPSPPHAGTVNLEFDAAAFLAALRRTAPAMSTEQTRFYLCGVFLSEGRLCATDGHRLALHTIAADVPATPDVIIPSAAVTRLIALLRGIAGSLAVAVSATQIAFSTPGWTLTSKLVDGQFPDYRRVLPPRAPVPLVVNRAALHDAVALVAKMYESSNVARAARLTAEGNELIVASAGAEALGTCEVTLAIENPEPAEPWATGLNSKYLVAAVDSIEAELVELHGLTDPMMPLWLCAAGEAHDGAVIVPMRV